jgi:hypothetical protein
MRTLPMSFRVGATAILGTVIDPLIQLAFAVQAGRGAYALLLGSGVSRSAEIKTGYEILVDLIEKAAVLSDADFEGDAYAWYRATFGEEPSYSRLLERLAATPAERQALLRAYFEPTEDERERGAKTPSPGHRAIAELARRGFVRVILTTNFDRLMEDALAEVGVRPYVVRSAADVNGAPAPSQIECLLVKLHGDYLNTGIRNTPEELAAYEPEVDAYLDRLLDDYGLIVCGWSGDWDEALRTAIARTPNRRLTSFWTSRSAPSALAQDLIDNRHAVVVRIEDADRFLQNLHEKVLSLDDLRTQRPGTVAVAVAAAKRYLVDPTGRIRLNDLIVREVEPIARMIAEVSERSPNGDDEYAFRAERFEAGSATLGAIAATTCFWGNADQVRFIVEAIQRLGARPVEGGRTDLLELKRYPASVVLYAAGVGAVAAGRYDALARLVRAPIKVGNDDSVAVIALAAEGVLDRGEVMTMQNRGTAEPQNFKTPTHDRMRDVVRAITSDSIPDEDRFDRTFDELEGLMGLVSGEVLEARGRGLRFIGGRHLWRRSAHWDKGLMQEFGQALDRDGATWPPVSLGLFPSVDRARELIDAYHTQLVANPHSF